MPKLMLAALAATVAMPATATTVLDLSGLPGGTYSGPIVFTDASLSSSTGNFSVGAAGQDHEVCPLTAALNCEATLTVTFNSPVTNLSFASLGDNAASNVFVTVNTLGGSFAYTGVSDDDFTSYDLHGLFAFTDITSIVITNDDPAGLAYDYFAFDVTGRGGGVPEPATWALMIAGFGAVGGALRRRGAPARHVPA